MTLADFPITKRWPPRHHDRLQLYSMPTPNGVKVSIMLEEIGLPYEAHRIDISTGETHTPEFLSLNPNGKIPAILDPDGPGGKPTSLFESAAILLYLAEKTGQLMPTDPVERFETLQWLFFQMSFIGPMLAELDYFHKQEGHEIADKRPLARYKAEAQRLLGVLDDRLTRRRWMMGDEYGLADIATFGWVRHLVGDYDTGNLVNYDQFENVARWLEQGLARPAVARGLGIPG